MGGGGVTKPLFPRGVQDFLFIDQKSVKVKINIYISTPVILEMNMN